MTQWTADRLCTEAGRGIPADPGAQSTVKQPQCRPGDRQLSSVGITSTVVGDLSAEIRRATRGLSLRCRRSDAEACQTRQRIAAHPGVVLADAGGEGDHVAMPQQPGEAPTCLRKPVDVHLVSRATSSPASILAWTACMSLSPLSPSIGAAIQHRLDLVDAHIGGAPQVG